MNLLDLLKAKTQQQNDVEFAPLQPITQDATQQATLQPIALNNDGTLQNNVAYVPEVKTTMADKVKNAVKQKFSLADALLGKQAEPTDTVGDMSATISNNPRSGGILRDISSGYNENLTTPASLDNFGQNTLPDGRNKGFAYRLGESLGSLSRFAQSPLGRSLIVGGIVSATGGTPLQALTYGSQTGAKNQEYRTNDKLYRDALAEQGIDTSTLKGYVNDTTFKNYSDANYKNKNLETKMQLAVMKDNTSRAKMIGYWLNNNQITPEKAAELIEAYGITDADFQESNQTKSTNAKVEKMNAETENIKHPKPKVTISHKYTSGTVNINHNSNGGSKTTKKTSTPHIVKSNKPSGVKYF